MRRLFIAVSSSLLLSLCFSFLPASKIEAGRCTPGDWVGWSDRGSNPDNSPCGGRSISRSKRRDGRNLRLECGASVDHYMRRPLSIVNGESIDDMMISRASQYGKTGEDILTELYWAEEKKDWKRHQDIMMAIYPDTKWSGRVDYNTYEAWEWTECYFGHDPSCPPDVSYVDEPVYDDKGKQIGTKKVRVETPKPCYHEENRSEKEHCSIEQMTYDAQMHKYNQSEWNPSSKGYYPIIANKDNLLACEYEDIQFYNTSTSLLSSSGTTMTPTVEVGDAWNEYTIEPVFTKGVPQPGSRSAACRYQHRYHVAFTVYTDKRLTNKQTPNCLRLPVNEFGDELASPFTDWEVTSDKGKEVQLKPLAIAFTDGSSVAIDSLSRQSREFEGSIEKEKEKHGKGANITKEKAAASAKDSGFWKDTHLKLVLYEQTWAYKRRKTEPMETRGAAVVPFRDKKGLDQYRIKLDNFYNSSNWGFLEWAYDKKTDLYPGREYFLNVSMFQEGVPFYDQSTWTGGKAWSKPIVVSFKRVEGHDNRSSGNRFRNWLADPIWLKFIHRPF